jgi:hypothetical protein
MPPSDEEEKVDTEMLLASIRGIFGMTVIPALFGFWQHSAVAAPFMFTLLIFFEKLFRALARRVERIEALLPTTEPASVEDE